MESNKKQPEVRFIGFCDSWASESLKNLAEINPKTILPDEFKYVDLESVVGIKLSNYRIEKKATAPSRAQRLAKKGDIFFQTVRPYQRNNYLFNLSDNDYVFSTGYAQIRPYLDSYFLFSKLQDDKFVSDVIDQCTGTSYPAINSNALSRIEIYFPNNKEEQKRIGALLENLDIRISCQQQELDTLKQTKQGFLQKMFPKEGESVPELRFPGFTEDWEASNLIDMTTLITKGTTPKDKYSKGNVNFIKVENIEAYSGVVSVTSKVSQEEHEGYLKRSQLKCGDILFSIAGTLGRTTVIKEEILPANTNQALAIIRLVNGNIDFIETYLKGKAVKDYIRKNPTVGAQPNLSLRQVGELSISYPSDLEQKKIGEFFKNLDRTIALKQQELDALKQTKKAFLQKMFV